MKLSGDRIQSLQRLLMELYGKNISEIEAQDAGVAIIRFVIAKGQRKKDLTMDIKQL
jgi:hypothetical protein